MFRSPIITWQEITKDVYINIFITKNPKLDRFKFTMEITNNEYPGIHGVSSVWYYTLCDAISDGLYVGRTTSKHFQEFITIFGQGKITRVTIIFIFNEIKSKYLAAVSIRDAERFRNNVLVSTAHRGGNATRTVRKLQYHKARGRRTAVSHKDIDQFWEELNFELY